MKLKDYIEERGIPTRVFAIRAGLVPVTVYKVLQGHNITLSSALKIQEFTKNEVTTSDILTDEFWAKEKKKKKKRAANPVVSSPKTKKIGKLNKR